jgi:hypothetical protein
MQAKNTAEKIKLEKEASEIAIFLGIPIKLL